MVKLHNESSQFGSYLFVEKDAEWFRSVLDDYRRVDELGHAALLELDYGSLYVVRSLDYRVELFQLNRLCSLSG